MGRDENMPKWVQHLALRVASVEALPAAKEELAAGSEKTISSVLAISL